MTKRLNNHYKTIVSRYYTAGIYEYSRAALERNKRRFRLSVDYVRWSGNTGCLDTRTIYLTIVEGRILLRQLRQTHKDELIGKADDCNIASIMQLTAFEI